MRKLLREFRSFALGGNILDLALGFLIGAAFSTVISSLTNDVILQLVAAIFRVPDFSKLKSHLHGADIRYGVFVTALINFMLLAVVLFLVIKVMTVVRVTSNRLEQRECPYCLDQVPIQALVCRACGQPLVKDLPSVDEAERRIAELRVRRSLSLPPIARAIPVRRRAGSAPSLGVVTLTEDKYDQQNSADDDDSQPDRE